MEIMIKQGGGTPIYVQMRNQIRDMILKQQIPDRFVLPSERALAKQTGVHRNTVGKVYSELCADGLIKAYQGVCYRVSYSGEKHISDAEGNDRQSLRDSAPISSRDW